MAHAVPAPAPRVDIIDAGASAAAVGCISVGFMEVP